MKEPESPEPAASFVSQQRVSAAAHRHHRVATEDPFAEEDIPADATSHGMSHSLEMLKHAGKKVQTEIQVVRHMQDAVELSRRALNYISPRGQTPVDVSTRALWEQNEQKPDLNKSGQHALRVGVQMLNAPSVPHMNRFLSNLYLMSWLQLLAAVLTVLVLIACPLGLLMLASGCQLSEVHGGATKLIAISFAGLSGMDIADFLKLPESTLCIVEVGLFRFTAVIIQSALFAVVVTKLIAPRSKFCISRRACVIRRNGKSLLTFRLCHPQGHFVTSLWVSATWNVLRKSAEGENFIQPQPLSFNTGAFNNCLGSIITLSHSLDDDSPFREFADDLSAAPGTLRILVQGYDEILRCQLTDTVSAVVAQRRPRHLTPLCPLADLLSAA